MTNLTPAEIDHACHDLRALLESNGEGQIVIHKKVWIHVFYEGPRP